MELLLLGLAGLGGLALLLQSKPLPSKEDAEKAFEKLEKDPTDQDANTIFGKYKAFVLGDYDGAMPYLVHSKDTTLKTLAEHELDATHTATATQKVGMGDEWVAATKKLPALNRIFVDRATQWYVTAWPDLDDVWKTKSREQAVKVSAARPPGNSRKGLPRNWQAGDATVQNLPSIDGTFARTGSHSIKIPPSASKVSTAFNGMQSDQIPFAGKAIEYSGYFRTEKTEGQSDELIITFYDATGGLVSLSVQKVPPDLPFWNRVVGKVNAPANATLLRLGSTIRSKNGMTYVDDMSVKVDGKEVLKNGSFEER